MGEKIRNIIAFVSAFRFVENTSVDRSTRESVKKEVCAISSWILSCPTTVCFVCMYVPTLPLPIPGGKVTRKKWHRL